MSRRVLPPDAFDEVYDPPDGWCYSTEPDDGDRVEHEFPEYDDFRERCELDARYDAEERFAAVLNDAERIGGAA